MKVKPPGFRPIPTSAIRALLFLLHLEQDKNLKLQVWNDKSTLGRHTLYLNWADKEQLVRAGCIEVNGEDIVVTDVGHERALWEVTDQ